MSGAITSAGRLASGHYIHGEFYEVEVELVGAATSPNDGAYFAFVIWEGREDAQSGICWDQTAEHYDSEWEAYRAGVEFLLDGIEQRAHDEAEGLYADSDEH